MNDYELELLEYGMLHPEENVMVKRLAFSEHKHRKQLIEEEWKIVRAECKTQKINAWKMKCFG